MYFLSKTQEIVVEKVMEISFFLTSVFNKARMKKKLTLIGFSDVYPLLP